MTDFPSLYILDDEAYIKICRETSRLNDPIECLLKLERIDEAKQAAHEAKDFDMLMAMNNFTRQGLTDIAVKLVEERLVRVEDDRLPERMTWEPLPPHNTVFDVPEEQLDHIFDEIE